MSMPIRTITEILKEADASTDYRKIMALWNEEIIPNKKRYPLIELKFAHEHIVG